MRSTSGSHFIALDHIRALAALLVFAWHFTHGRTGYPSPFHGSGSWSPFVFFDEGHVGVALFMSLSGYLFAKLLDGKRINYRHFLYNRFLRLFPLLIVVIIIKTILIVFEFKDARFVYWFFLSIPKGLLYPVWPNGGWSITVELHFYLILPALLFLKRKSPLSLLSILLAAITLRYYIYTQTGDIQQYAYWTIVGRIDQFLLGILAFEYRHKFKSAHLKILAIAIVFTSVYCYFNKLGGLYRTEGNPLLPPMWVILPSIEGAAFSAMIAWYESTFTQNRGFISKAVSVIGEYSYSIYLLHFFVVFALAEFIHKHIIDISNYYTALAVSLLAFCTMIPVGYVSMKLIEAPFLKMRRPYYIK